MNSFDDDVVQETLRLNLIAPVSGVDYSDQIQRIHLFFSRLPKPLRLNGFKNLAELVVIGQSIPDLSFLEECVDITHLWVCECGLRTMSYIKCLTKIEELCLFDNKIKEIEGLDNCATLRKLWLNDNDINVLSGFDRLSRLCDLNISGNKIKRLDSNLIECKALTTLDISGNPFYDLPDIISLSLLPKLEHLRINDAQYKPSPISSNRHTLLALIHHLHQLSTLDDFYVKGSSLPGFVESIVADKRLYYFSKYRHQLNCLQRAQQNLVGLNISLVKPIFNRVCLLDTVVRAIGTYLDMSIGLDRFNHDDFEKYNKKAKLISIRKRWWESKYSSLEIEYTHCLQELIIKMSLIRCLAVCELQMFGGLIISSVPEGHEWFKLCERFCQQRICWHDPYLDSFSNLRLRKVFQIKNEFLIDHVLECYSDNGVSLEHLLFYSRIFTSDNDFCHLGNILRSGFNNDAAAGNLRFTTLLNTILKKDASLAKLQYNKSFHLLIVRVVSNDKNDCISTNIQFPLKNLRTKSLTHKRRRTCGCAMNHSEHCYSSGDTLVPEYLIDVELLAHSPIAQFADYLKYDFVCAPNLGSLESLIAIGTEQDSAIIKSPPDVPVAPQLGDSSLEDVLRLSWFNRVSEISTSNIAELNFTGTGIKDLRQLERLRALKTLVLSNCGLTTLEGLCCQALERLDVSHNSLSSLESMNEALALTTLDVNWNSLTNLEKDVHHLKKITTKLVCISMEYNPWLRKGGLMDRAESILPTLRTITKAPDKGNPTGIERFRRAHVFTYSKTCMLTVWPIARSLSRHSSASSENIDEFMASVLMFDRIFFWKLPFSQICYHSLGSLSMNNTCLIDLSPLTSMSQLQELSIEDNCLTSLRGIHYLYNLQTLLAGSNFISSISGCGFNYLKNLQVLGLDNNHLSSLDSLANNFNLKQLFMSGNRISHYRTVLALNDILSLSVLDFRFNPVTNQVSNYRQRTIFHFPHLCSLDGSVVHTTEVADAKEALGGRLTSEFILAAAGHDFPSQLTQIDCEDRGFRVIDLCPPETFTNLHTINLQDNKLTSFAGLLQLKNLQVLCLAGNKITTLLPSSDLRDVKGSLLPHLLVLSLARNDLTCLKSLQLNRFPALDTLFLQGNLLTTTIGLEGITRLRALVLDNNRLRKLSSDSFATLSNLEELHLEDNRIRELPTFPDLGNLERLYIGGNKLEDISALCESLICLSRLRHLTVFNNPLAKHNSYRYVLWYRLPDLQTLDALQITDEDSQMAFTLFSNQPGQGGNNTDHDADKPTSKSANGGRRRINNKSLVSQIILPPVGKLTILSSDSESGREAIDRPSRPMPPPPQPPPAPNIATISTAKEAGLGSAFVDASIQIKKALELTSHRVLSFVFSPQMRACSPPKNDLKSLCIVSKEFQSHSKAPTNTITTTNNGSSAMEKVDFAPKPKKFIEKKRRKTVLSIPGISINAIVSFKPHLPGINNSDNGASNIKTSK